MRSSNYNVFITTTEPHEYILYNTFSKAIVAVDEELRKAVDNQTFEIIPSNVLETLIKEGIILKDDIQEEKILQTIYEKSKWFPIGRTMFTAVITYDCNLRCPYCYVGAGRKRTNTMNSEIVERALNFIKLKSKENRAKEISLGLYGGEPFLEKEVALKLAEETKRYAKEVGAGFLLSAITNGTLITKDLAQKLLDLDLKSIQMTLDGPKHYHDKKRFYENGKGTYDDIIGVIAMLMDMGLTPYIRINLDSENFPYLTEVLSDLESRGLQKCRVGIGLIKGYNEACASYPFNVSDEEEARLYSDALDLVTKRGFNLATSSVMNVAATYCYFLTDNIFAIDPNGDIYKCMSFIGMKDFAVGSLNADGSFKENPFYYTWMSRNPFLMEQCQTCKILPMCWGGCPADAYMDHKKVDGPSCLPKVKNVEERVRLYLKLHHPEEFANDKIVWKKDNAATSTSI